MEQKVHNLSIPMKDGSTQKLSVTRNDIEYWLTEHELAKLMDADVDRLLSNFCVAYQKDYNKTHPKPKGQRGGARPNAGRKGKAGGSFHHGFRFSAKVHDILEEHREDMTGFVESAILAYERAYNAKKKEGAV